MPSQVAKPQLMRILKSAQVVQYSAGAVVQIGGLGIAPQGKIDLPNRLRVVAPTRMNETEQMQAAGMVRPRFQDLFINLLGIVARVFGGEGACHRGDQSDVAPRYNMQYPSQALYPAEYRG